MPVLLEVILDAIAIDASYASSAFINEGISVVDLIFRIAFKDPANVQLISDSTDCLNALLKNVNMRDYMVICERSLPFIFNIMESSTGEYSPELYLALELLSIIIKLSPEEELPSQIFEYAFPILTKILIASLDNQILQSGGEVFNELIKTVQVYSLHIMIQILMKQVLILCSRLYPNSYHQNCLTARPIDVVQLLVH